MRPWPTSGRARLVRVGHGAGIAAIGVAAAIGFDEYWSTHGSYGGSVSLGGDLVFGAMPFLLLGVIAIVYGSTYLPWVAVAGLLVLTYFEYKSNATTDSSTASLAFLGSWFIGVPIAVAAPLIESAFRQRR